MEKAKRVNKWITIKGLLADVYSKDEKRKS